MQRSEELRRGMLSGANRPGIPSNTGGAATGLQPVFGSESRGSATVVATPGSASTAPRIESLTSKADASQVAKAAGQKDAFAVAMERIRNVNDEDNAGFGMSILLKIDLKGRESEVFDALGPYLDSPFENRAAVALLVLERIDDPRRVDELIRRLGKHRQTDPIFCGMLAKWKDPRAIEPLANQLDGFPLWKHFDNALIAFGPAAETAVIAKLADADKNTRKRACEILGQIGGDESLKIFGKLKPDSDPFVRMAASAAITNIRNRLGKPAGRRTGR
jgi:HEAT repeat protein